MAYLPTTSQKMTFDTDDRRPDNHPSSLVLPTGQHMIFYSKFLTTGKESFSRISFIGLTFTINVEAGSGAINGIPVTWGSGVLTASPNTYQIVYSDSAGVLHISAIMPMVEASSAIILAYVQSGNSSITRIEEIEHTGYYLYIRKQVLSGTNWVWDNYEYRLNTGEEPEAYYDTGSNKIYLSYKKDSVSYLRMFDPTNQLTWDYLPNINISVSNITLNTDPESSIVVAVSAGYASYTLLASDEYPLKTPEFCFIKSLPYIILPNVIGDNIFYSYGEVSYDVLTYSGGSYTVEATYSFPRINYDTQNLKYVPWVGTFGLKYIRFRTFTRLFAGQFVTSPSNYMQLYIFDFPATITLADGAYNVKAKGDSLINTLSSGYQVAMITAAEYVETRTFQSENSPVNTLSSGYQVVMEKTAEYEETKTFQSESSPAIALSSGYKAYISIINV